FNAIEDIFAHYASHGRGHSGVSRETLDELRRRHAEERKKERARHDSWGEGGVGTDDDTFADAETAAAPPPQPVVQNANAEKRAPDPEAAVIPILHPAWCSGCARRMAYRTMGIWSRGEIWHRKCLD